MFGLSLPAIPFLPFLSGNRDPDPDPVILSRDQVDEIGRELDALRERTVASLGSEDREYIYRVIKAQRGFEVAGRGLLFLGFLPPAWIAGVAALSVSKILDNMEIGHNVMHGQYDWMREPSLNSLVFEWDTVCPSDQWRHSHNFVHHTYTNILDMDRDIGYGILRMDPAQPWKPYYLGNPLYAAVLMLVFEWGVMLHDAEADRVLAGKRDIRELGPLARGWWHKAGRQVLKDYVVFPLLSGPLFVPTLLGNATANLVRNVWAFSVIFCGHFPSGVQSFTQEETAGESRGEWYVRQLLGSANISGSSLMHLMTGNLSHQIEHHLFPDLPARRYPQIAPQVRALCEKHGLPYNTGGLLRQVASVWGKIFRLALPPSWVSDQRETAVVIERRPRPEPAVVEPEPGEEFEEARGARAARTLVHDTV
ncbi:acyl-CoA desaturase [Rhodococcus sp. HM1]|uniref:fatty acid desaturase family protein n=1 Tax=Rhodococcus sp. HM1 TaxID=2937759 RepID=UPI00200AD0C4|nr:acyl-CoA desaturase [Rhodococcus sp. HM1]MCK8671392.1 acyl-CoA desaturase [Rhodococcus sp. HM1]